jgi:hypothetical protein
MTTVSYAVYEVETGEVVHLHIESAALDTSPEEILAIADPGRAGNLAVVQVPAEGLPAGAARVVAGELRPAEKAAGFGAAGTAGGLVEPPVERRYEPQPRGGARATGSGGLPAE